MVPRSLRLGSATLNQTGASLGRTVGSDSGDDIEFFRRCQPFRGHPLLVYRRKRQFTFILGAHLPRTFTWGALLPHQQGHPCNERPLAAIATVRLRPFRGRSLVVRPSVPKRLLELSRVPTLVLIVVCCATTNLLRAQGLKKTTDKPTRLRVYSIICASWNSRVRGARGEPRVPRIVVAVT